MRSPFVIIGGLPDARLGVRRGADLAHRHVAECAHKALLPFGRQRLPGEMSRYLAHRVIQASAPTRTALGGRVSGIHRILSNYQRSLVWCIEQLFRVAKSQGLGLEDSQMASAERLMKLTAAALKAACIDMQLVQERDGKHGLPASTVFAPAEIATLEALNPTLQGSTEKQKNPHPVFSLAWAAWVIARLGYWHCYGKPPGPITIHRGMERFKAIHEGFHLGLDLQRDVRIR